MKTIICICTYQRPQGLARLLNTLRAQDLANNTEIVVVDNDAAAEGMAALAALDEHYPWPVHCGRSPEGGISAARNCAVTLALARQPDFLAFLDDDEWPSSEWFGELHRVQRVTGADAVGGPTRPRFPVDVDPAVAENPYFGADLDLPDAAPCQLQAAGNFLISRRVLEPLAPDFFHPAFGLSGGEDLAFFTQLAQRGARMHWARRAIVFEEVPPVRLTERWMRDRVVNIANSRVRVAQLLEPGLRPTLLRVAKTAVLGTQALLVSIASLTGLTARQRGALLRWKFEGKLRAHIGHITIRREEI